MTHDEHHRSLAKVRDVFERSLGRVHPGVHSTHSHCCTAQSYTALYPHTLHARAARWQFVIPSLLRGARSVARQCRESVHSTHSAHTRSPSKRHQQLRPPTPSCSACATCPPPLQLPRSTLLQRLHSALAPTPPPPVPPLTATPHMCTLCTHQPPSPPHPWGPAPCPLHPPPLPLARIGPKPARAHPVPTLHPSKVHSFLSSHQRIFPSQFPAGLQ